MQCDTWSMRPAILALAVFTATAGLSCTAVANDNPADRYQYQPRPITLPPGFRVEMVAAPPLLQHPMMGCFDDRGRLFIAEAAGLNLRSPDLDKQLPNSILMLEDLDDDGYFDKTHVFADKMTNPNGAAWHDGALYVASPPHIWRLRDTTGDGFADERTTIAGGFQYSGIANSLHGPVFAPDGRMYWMQGIGGNGGNIEDHTGRVVVPESWPGIFSCWPDGSDLRKHINGGMDNPVEVAFTPEGQMLGTVNLIGSRPRNDAVVHWQWGGVYPRRDRIEAERRFPRTGDLLPTTVDFGHVAVSGLLRYRSRQFGDECRGNLFVTEFNPHRVRRVDLQPQGATFRGEIHDFLSSPDTDTHFTDVIEDADGSLLVIDTGGWFRNGCPVSQVAKPQLKGAIYRVSRVDAPPVDDPRGLQLPRQNIPAGTLIGRLNDDRFAVRDRAVVELAKLGDPAVPAMSAALSDATTPIRTRRNIVWALCRIRTPPAMQAARQALSDPDSGIREAAAHAAFVNRDAAAVEPLLTLLSNTNPAVRREAAAALGILADERAVPALLSAAEYATDRQLEHALIYALIEINDAAATRPGLTAASPAVRRAALIALDQMPDGQLTQKLVAPLLDTSDERLQQAALDVITRHEEWAAASIDLLRQWLNQQPLPPEREAALRKAVIAFQQIPAVQQMVTDKLGDPTTPPQTRLLLLDVIAAIAARELPETWKQQLGLSLQATSTEEIQRAVAAITALALHDFDERLANIASDSRQAPALRIAAAAVVADGGVPLDDSLCEVLLEPFRTDADPLDKLVAAGALAGAKLSDAQRRRIIGVLPKAGPLELPTLLRGFTGAADPALGRELIAALQTAPGADALSAAQLSALLQSFPTSVLVEAEPLLRRLNPDRTAQAARLEELSGALTGGDAERGRAVFFGKRATCGTCHRVRGEGGLVGPDLSTIGDSRTRRDLLESIVFPSLSFAQGYETYHVLTKAGKTVSGVIARRAADAVYLRTADRDEIRVSRDDVDEIGPSDTSLMPQGLDRALTKPELQDLTAFLSTLRSEQ